MAEPNRTVILYEGCVAVDGDRRIVYTISLDWDQLKAQAIKAADSKRQKSTDGAVTVRVTGAAPKDKS